MKRDYRPNHDDIKRVATEDEADFYQHLGRVLQREMNRRGIHLVALSQEAHLSTAFIQQILNGEVRSIAMFQRCFRPLRLRVGAHVLERM